MLRRKGSKAAVGVEPTNNGFANRHLNQDKPLQNQHLHENSKNDLAEFLALLKEKDPDLALVVKAWPNLPEHIKAAVKALVRSYQEDEHRQKENE